MDVLNEIKGPYKVRVTWRAIFLTLLGTGIRSIGRVSSYIINSNDKSTLSFETEALTVLAWKLLPNPV